MAALPPLLEAACPPAEDEEDEAAVELAEFAPDAVPDTADEAPEAATLEEVADVVGFSDK